MFKSVAMLARKHLDAVIWVALVVAFIVLGVKLTEVGRLRTLAASTPSTWGTPIIVAGSAPRETPQAIYRPAPVANAVRDGLTPKEWAAMRTRQGAQWALDRFTQGVNHCARTTQRRLRAQEGWSSDWSETGAAVAGLACAIVYSPLGIFGTIFGGQLGPSSDEKVLLPDEEARRPFP